MVLYIFTLFFFNKQSSKYRYTTSGIGEILVENYNGANKRLQKTVRKISWRILDITLAEEVIRIFVLQLVTMNYLLFQIQNGRLDVSSFVALFLATMQLSFELFNFVNCFNSFYKLSLYTEDLIFILNFNSDIEVSDSKNTNTKSVNSVDSLIVRNITISHDGKKNILNDISMDINSFRNMFGIVFQDYRFYAVTVTENILLRKVKTKADRELVIDALKKSQLYTDIASLPHGIDTVLTKEFDEDGIVLSGGQSQKLALARVFVQNDRKIFILDEASSAMDPISESKVNKAILDFCKDKIPILISHRLSISKEMDKVYLLKTAGLQKAEVISN